jgi:cytosine/adenosine deaminase-related metal-dependent hydrolase
MGSVLETDEQRRIIAIHPPGSGIEADHHFETGVLCPGFINAHCHLELSHMKGVIPEGTGLMVFLMQVMKLRSTPHEERDVARKEALNEMLRSGIVAVGDIANTTDTLDVRSSGQLQVHSFVEALGFLPVTAAKRFDAALQVWQTFADQQTGATRASQSITAHSPYSVSPDLFRLIDKHEPTSLLSIHNAESNDENEFYQQGTGGVTLLLDSIGLDTSFYTPHGNRALPTYGSWLSPDHRVILVHNTVATSDDIRWATGRFRETWWCLCPGANRYIEGNLPNVPMLIEETDNICIGTDSLASNHQLSVLAELQILKAFYPALQWESMLRWGTLNGAKALGMDDRIGSFDPGKQPGILHIADLTLGTPVRLD